MYRNPAARKMNPMNEKKLRYFSARMLTFGTAMTASIATSIATSIEGSIR